jgi:hypothetical protein
MISTKWQKRERKLICSPSPNTWRARQKCNGPSDWVPARSSEHKADEVTSLSKPKQPNQHKSRTCGKNATGNDAVLVKGGATGMCANPYRLAET